MTPCIFHPRAAPSKTAQRAPKDDADTMKKGSFMVSVLVVATPTSCASGICCDDGGWHPRGRIAFERRPQLVNHAQVSQAGLAPLPENEIAGVVPMQCRHSAQQRTQVLADIGRQTLPAFAPHLATNRLIVALEIPADPDSMCADEHRVSRHGGSRRRKHKSTKLRKHKTKSHTHVCCAPRMCAVLWRLIHHAHVRCAPRMRDQQLAGRQT